MASSGAGPVPGVRARYSRISGSHCACDKTSAPGKLGPSHRSTAEICSADGSIPTSHSNHPKARPDVAATRGPTRASLGTVSFPGLWQGGIHMLFATFALVGLTAVYVWLTHRLLRAQVDPHVIVYALDDRERPTLIEIVIENVGRNVAEDVRFEVSQPLVRAYGVSPEDPPSETRPLDNGPLVTGIPALGPGGTRRLVWGQYGGLR